MRVMVTGGTGFVGAHTVRALADAGHEVRLLVRNPARIDENVKALGVDVDDFVVGDMTDPAAVGKALDGCDAVIHAAAVVSIERRRAHEMQLNPKGVEVVVGGALDRGLDPIVYVSSVSALFEPGRELLHADTPPAQAEGAYGQSKSAAEERVRAWQAEGAPIASTYPGGVLGPPAGTAFGEVADTLVPQLKYGILPTRDGALSVIDVRDLGAIHAALVEPGRGPRRYICGGHLLSLDEVYGYYREVTGRALPALPLPGAVMRVVGRAMDVVMHLTPVDSIVTGEAMTMMTQWVPTDDRLIKEELGIDLRDPGQTYTDTIRALYRAGRLSARHVGRVAENGGT